MDVTLLEMELAGRKLSIETGRLAKQANGSALVRYGDTVVLVAVTASTEPREGIDFFPLTVDYEERLYAVGRIPGGFIKREGRPSERGVLACRLTDRPIRPLFPSGFRNDVQIVATVLSVEYDNAFEICGILGASAALSLSDIPFKGPVAAVIVGLVDGQLVLNPTQAEAARSDLHLVVAGTREAVLMIEAGANEVPEAQILEAIYFGHEAIKQMILLQDDLVAKAGKPKREVPLFTVPEEIVAAAREIIGKELHAAVHVPEKLAREEAMAKVRSEAQHSLHQRFSESHKEIEHVLQKLLKEEVRQGILVEGLRPDNRRLDEIRPITCEVGILPRTHGTGLFTRGQTQALTVCTLGALSEVQILDGLGTETEKRYIHQYNFPPFSTGEAKPLRGPSRRSIGHGALAERALSAMIPSPDEFPYTIRLVSEILESNGSSSMASVCGSTLSLMDAGVPIKAPVAGVAMGLVKEGHRAAVLTDIQGLEDALGDMDFKVTGTTHGVTAIQMDIKIGGLDRDILEKALEQARQGRLFILERMLEVLSKPRPELSPFAPRILTVKIDPERIREVIGPGGKTINRIIDQSKVGDQKVEIDIDDDGTIRIAAVNAEGGQRAKQLIEELVKEIRPGEVYQGRVTRIMNFGAFVEILPGKEGLVHISQLANERVAKVEDVVNVGDEVTVKVTEIDRMGRINLTLKDALAPV